MRMKNDKYVENRKKAADLIIENLENPMFVHRMLIVYSEEQSVDEIDFTKIGNILAKILRFDSPDMHIIRSVAASGDAGARERLRKRHDRLKESWTTFLATAASLTTNTFADVAQLSLDLKDSLQSK
jgi:hypothetical protein